MHTETSLGVYVHWPYCTRICPYCDFNVYKNRQIDAVRWAAALTTDLTHWAQVTPGRRLKSLYFGGGTPSLAPVSVISSAIDACDQLWGFEPGAEITLEANPTDAEQLSFQNFKAAGVNRLSLGVQSLEDDALRFLGRNHNATEAMCAIETAQAVFDRVTFDLIYALPGRSANDWQFELSTALATGVSHLSLYQLTIEPGTAFQKAVNRNAWAPAGENASADMYEISQELTAASGLLAYETSNHAAPGEESRHNLIYWNYQDYIGVGPGAHGRLTTQGARLATAALKNPDEYLKNIEAAGNGAKTIEMLSEDDQLVERMSMGLRLRNGITLYADDYFYNSERRVIRLSELIDEGMLTLNCGTLKVSEKGRPLLDAILSRLLT